MIITILYIVAALLVALNLLLELKRDLMMLQQNSYRRERYMKWLSASGDTTSVARLLGMAVFFVSLVTFSRPDWSMGAMMLFGGLNSLLLLRRRYKKPLVWTNRARRIYAVALSLCVIVVAGVVLLNLRGSFDFSCFMAALSMMFLYIVSHVVTVASVFFLQPVEKRINDRYYREAEEVLKSMPDLKIVGITGSYGKTSTKHYLNRILSEHYDVVMTPGSFNTTLGVIRTIREYLKPYNEVFIVEMGAKNVGDIKEICDLVNPHVGIVTAVGEQHLESFGSIENVCRTKFELVDSLPSDGLAVVNDDFAFAANRKVGNVECVRYAIRNTDGVEYTARDIEYSSSGTSFTVEGEGHELRLHTRLVGECNISNLLAAVVVALRLGVPEEKIRYAVEKIEQVEHRLSIKRTAGGVTIIDDAFNSNPTGSGMALDVLSGMTGGKRIVVTPGMIELGDRQEECNREFGRHIARCADVAIIVGEYNRNAIISGISEAGMPDDKVRPVADFNEAQRVLATILATGDTVLYENDLPDTFK